MNDVVMNEKKIYPSKIVCVGLNYVKHIEELKSLMPKEPVIFCKPNSAISNTIKLHSDEEIDYEAELCFLIKNGEFFGVGFGLDLTKRIVQKELKKSGYPWERSKAFDGSAIFSPFISFDVPKETLSIELKINKKTVQVGTVENMMVKPKELLNNIKKFMSLENGDIIMTGTPEGVGRLYPDDHLLGKVYTNSRQIIEFNKCI